MPNFRTPRSTGRLCWCARVALLICLPAPLLAQTPLDLAGARQLALSHQPRLLAQKANTQAARAQAQQAGGLPDPQLRIGVVNLPATGAGAFSFSRDAMTMRMIGIAQSFPRAEKRELAARRARLEGDASEQESAFLRRAILRDVTLAWVELDAAARAEALLTEVDAELQRQAEALLVSYRAGRATQAEVQAARLERDVLGDRRAQLSRQQALARADLSRWIGEAADGPLQTTLPPLPPLPALPSVLADVQAHPHLTSVARQIDIAETELELARAARRPDWSLEVSYGYREAADSDMVTVQVGIDLPFLQRGRRLHEQAARQAQVEQARALHADNLAEMRASVRRLHAEWAAASTRMDHYERTLLPQAGARVEASLAAYRGGKGELMPVLEARRALVELRLQRLTLEGEARRAIAQLEYFRPHEGRQP